MNDENYAARVGRMHPIVNVNRSNIVIVNDSDEKQNEEGLYLIYNIKCFGVYTVY